MTSCLILLFLNFVLSTRYIIVCLLFDCYAWLRMISNLLALGVTINNSAEVSLHLFINRLIQTYCIDNKPKDVLELDDTYSILHSPFSIHLPPITEIRSDPGISAVYFRHRQSPVLVKPSCTCMITEQNSNTSIPPLQYLDMLHTLQVYIYISLYFVSL